MREQLIQYVELLFAGYSGSDDIKQEILQNTLDRYDDLVSEGKTPQAAYSLAISGIGDLGEILGKGAESPSAAPCPAVSGGEVQNTPVWKKILQACAIFLYIIAIIPLIVLAEFGLEIIGLCGTLGIVAIATVLLVFSSNDKEDSSARRDPGRETHTQKGKLSKAIGSLTGAAGLCIYLLLSFSTGAWHITWLVFPIMGAVRGLIKAILDLREAAKHES